ncbi:MAG: hypothetical protein H6627_12720 [Calditrichae bacterium]|nr:hypothetical protein [Calditrichia bacterium]
MAALNNYISLHHLKRIFKNQHKIILLVMLFGFLVEFLFTFILSASAIRKFAESYFKLLPPMVKQMTGFLGENLVGSQFIAFGYTHPAVLFILSFIPVAIASRYITAELENRSIELLSSRLLPRHAVVLTPFLFILLSFLTVFGAMLSGSLLGRLILDMNEDIQPFILLKIALTGLLFFTAISTITLYISTLFSERGKALAWSSGIILFAFVFDAIIRLWDQIAFLKPYSLFNWYQPVNIATGQYNFEIGIPLLALLSSGFLSAAVRHFNHRDL